MIQQDEDLRKIAENIDDAGVRPPHQNAHNARTHKSPLPSDRTYASADWLHFLPSSFTHNLLWPLVMTCRVRLCVQGDIENANDTLVVAVGLHMKNNKMK